MTAWVLGADEASSQLPSRLLRVRRAVVPPCHQGRDRNEVLCVSEERVQ